MSGNNVFSRTPYRSGNSQVISVTGVPGISSNRKLHFKRVELNGKTVTLMASYDEISEYELEQVNEISIVR